MFKNYLSTLLIVLMLLAVGCQENVNEEEFRVENAAQDSEEFKLNLRKAALVFGEILQDSEAREELAEYANLEGNAGEIEFSIKGLFFPEDASNLRKSSAIVRQFHEITSSIESSRTNGTKEKMDADDLLKFIEENDVSIIAPYLAENFNLSEIDELTVSYWTEDMDSDDPDYKGETPGYRIKFNANKADRFINWRSVDTKAQNENDWIIVNDEYAIENPTIVIRRGIENPYSPNSDLNYNGRIGDKHVDRGENLSTTVNSHPLCTDLKEGDRHTLKMPHFRLTTNIRSWPNANYMYLWVITGEFEVNSNGTPKPGSNTHHTLSGVKVSRSQATNKFWIQGPSFIVHDLKHESDEFIMIWGVDRPKTTRKYSGEVKLSDKAKPSGTLKAEWVLERHLELIPYAPINKCYYMEDNKYMRDLGHGRYGDVFPIYSMSQIQFWLVMMDN
jgi:hypothetical protein